MAYSKELITGMFGLNTDALEHTLKGITDENAFNRPAETCTPAHFVFGHIITYRIDLANLLGIPAENPLGKMFAYKSAPGEPSEYPPLSELKNAWDAITAKIETRLKEINEAELDAEAPFEVAPLSKTVGGCAGFMIFHEAYHIGQIGYLRRFYGLERAFG